MAERAAPPVELAAGTTASLLLLPGLDEQGVPGLMPAERAETANLTEEARMEEPQPIPKQLQL